MYKCRARLQEGLTAHNLIAARVHLGYIHGVSAVYSVLGESYDRNIKCV